MNASHPHCVRVSAPFGRVRIVIRTACLTFQFQQNLRAVAAEDITLPVGKMIRAYYGFRYHRIRRANRVVGNGSAVSPITFCLSAQGLSITDPTIVPPSTV